MERITGGTKSYARTVRVSVSVAAALTSSPCIAESHVSRVYQLIE